MEGMLGLAECRPTQGWFDCWGFSVSIALGIAIVVTIVLQVVVRGFRRRLEGSPSLTQELNLQRIATLTGALSTTSVVVVWSVAGLIALDSLGVPLAAVFASAGVVGVALGFGAQSIVKDTLSGFFILLENQFGVGDVIDVSTSGGPVGGKVEALTLRITMLRAFDGALHIVPNGNIVIVSNKSRGWARAIVDTRIAYGQDPEHVRALLDELFDELREDAQVREWVMDGPSVLGVETTSDTGVVIRAVAETRPSKRPDVERLLRSRITTRLSDRGIRAPVTAAPPPASTSGA
jgi:small conductance mechanosensitive channel